MRRLKGKAELKTTEVEKVENASSIFYAPTILVAGTWLLFLLIEKAGLKTKVKEDSHATKLPGDGALLLFMRFMMNSGAAPTFASGAWVTFFVMEQFHKTFKQTFLGAKSGLAVRFKFLLAFTLLLFTLPSVYSYNPGGRHLRLALINPNVYCLKCYCVYPIPPHFTLHGLWQQNFPRSYVGSSRLSGRDLSGVRTQILLDYWPDLRTERPQNGKGIFNCYPFWNREWQRHGEQICAVVGWMKSQYISKSLHLAANCIPHLPTVFANPKIVRNGQQFYDPKDIRQAIFDKLGFYVVLRCTYMNNNELALEHIFFCVDLSGNLASCTNWYDAAYNEGCGKLIILPPAPLSFDLDPLQQDPYCSGEF